MKKPTKGSARTRKFASGGDVAALAGLGTLAYLLSRKKDKEKEEGGLKGSGESTPKPSIKSMQSEDERIPASKGASEEPPEPEKSKVYKAEPGTGTAKSVKPIARKKPAASQSFPLTTPAKEAPSKPSKIKQLDDNSAAAKALREQRKQRLGANYAAQSRALASAPEGPGKEALAKSVEKARRDYEESPMKKGGAVKKYAKGGSVGSASKRADGIAQRGKTRGKVF